MLCSLPVLASALPVSVPALTAAQLRARILGSASRSYSGYAESNATFGLPPLSGLSSVTSLLDGVTRMRVWQATPDRWRVDVLSDAGEKDTYQAGNLEFQWNSGAQLLTEIVPASRPGAAGSGIARLPRAADLIPVPLALRVLAQANGHARYATLAPLRVAGQSAAGLRITPSDPASTVGHVDIWAVPSTGLPLMVEVYGRGARTPALQSQFFQVGPWRPDPDVLGAPPHGAPGDGFTIASAANLAGVLNHLLPGRLPVSLAGRQRVPAPPGFADVGLYGTGLALFVVFPVRDAAFMAGARSAGGIPYSFPSGGTGYLLNASLVNAVVAQSRSGTTFLLAGTVSGALLLRAAVTLTGESP